MSRRWSHRMVLVVLCCLAALPACSGGGDGQANGPTTTAVTESDGERDVERPPPAGEGAVFDPEADPSPKELEEPPPLNNAARLSAEASRYLDFCQGWTQIRGIGEPHPEKLGELLNYGRLHHALLTQIDTEAAIPNRGARPGEEDELELPQEVKDALAVERRELWAFLTRVLVIQAHHKAGAVDDDGVQRVLDRAAGFLAAGPYSRADNVLTRFFAKSCA